MVRKHPLIFGQADVIVVNKIDLAPYMDIDLERIREDAGRIAPHTPVFFTDAKHGKGLDEVMGALGL